MIYCVIVYDVSDNKVRRIVGEMLEGYGVRVNRSVFECSIKNRATLTRLQQALEKEIDPRVDSVRCYELCTKCMTKAWSTSHEADPFEKEAVYFF